MHPRPRRRLAPQPRRIRRAAAKLAVVLALALAVLACKGPALREEGGVLRDRDGRVSVPDWTREGWRRLDLEGTDAAFGKGDLGVIAVRLRCGPPGDEASTPLWLGVPRDALQRRERQLDGQPAVELSARDRGFALRTVAVRSGACTLDAAQSAPAQKPGMEEEFERFLAGIRLSGTAQ